MTTVSTGARAVVLQAASMCLQYPDAALLAQLPVAAEAVAGLPPSPSREALARFLDRAAATAPGELARHYVELFDTRKRCCLY
ncbi:MAG TPA: nitrate reductase molybdenum cofactor assembly chaperone, partial [Phytomonospora sp.]